MLYGGLLNPRLDLGLRLLVQRKLGAFSSNLKFSDALSSATDRINLGPRQILPPTSLDLPRYALVILRCALVILRYIEPFWKSFIWSGPSMTCQSTINISLSQLLFMLKEVYKQTLQYCGFPSLRTEVHCLWNRRRDLSFLVWVVPRNHA